VSLLDEVKQRADIVQVVSKYVDLDTRSRVPKGLCPFHNERSPSFVVYPETGTWHCFGACATGGDAIGFVMKKEGIPFSEALHRLAEEVGVDVRAASPAVRKPDTDPYQANEAAAAYFLARLKSPDGTAARAYLEGRSISMEVAERRGMGLAADGLETLAGHLRAKGVDGRAARDAGLVTRGRDGAWRDMFRGRLTIEIRDQQGRICGFGARSLDSSEPKYINTARSETFDKGRLLYGLNWAADTIRATGRAVVVEGYMDAIAAQEGGFKETVASMGTSVTAAQMETLARLVSRPQGQGQGSVVLCLDADAAGEEATLRELADSWKLFAVDRRGTVQIRVARPEGGKDPDEVIRADPEAWRRTVTGAVPFLEFMIDAYAARFDVATPAGKAGLFDAVRGPVLAMSNTYEQDRYWSLLAKRMGVQEDRVRAMLTRPAAGAAAARTSRRRRTGDAGPVDQAQLAAALEGRGETALEDFLLSLVLIHDDLREYAVTVPEEHFLDTLNREVFRQWLTSQNPAPREAQTDDPIRAKIEQLRLLARPPSDHPQRIEALSQCVRRLRERHLRHLKTIEEQAFTELGPQMGPETRAELGDRALESNARLRQVFAGRV
jgi:DNA primase